MSSLSLRLPESLHQKLRELAERDDISINQFEQSVKKFTPNTHKTPAPFLVSELTPLDSKGGDL